MEPARLSCEGTRRGALRALAAALAASLAAAGRRAAAAGQAEVGFIRNIPPFADEFARDGIFVDLMRMALQADGRVMVPRFFPNLQLEFDPLARFPNLSMYVGAQAGPPTRYPAVKLYEFHDVAVTKARLGLRIDSFRDLVGKRVLAYGGAHQLLGPAFNRFHRHLLADSPAYAETQNRLAQNQAFWQEQVDVILIDRDIFHYHRKVLAARKDSDTPGIDYAEKVTFHEIFREPVSVHAVGRSAGDMQRLEHQLKTMKSTGAFQQIVDRYTQMTPPRTPSPLR
ncbi:hypothetical protein V4F39_07320 [Aquincola sp. MAHUQ-54]|uniref:Amino acid ABC transporter substrate-binding protein (PAAT family) n=1 Tax=Aquincola agrisoli TaxID=3119538 RepID=A0AAW9QBI5_9BURK